MKNKKSIFILLGLVLAIGIMILFLRIFVIKDKIEYKSYDKYSTSISINTTVGEAQDSILMNVYDDGDNAKITSNKVNLDTYIIDEYMFYLKDTTFYKLKSTKSYRNIYDVCTNFKDLDKEKEIGEYTHYTTVIKAKEVNEILSSLYFGKKTSSDTTLKLVVKDDFITEVSFIITDIEGYEEISINILFESLEEDYEIDTSAVQNVNHFRPNGIVYDIKETRDNPYEIVN